MDDLETELRLPGFCNSLGEDESSDDDSTNGKRHKKAKLPLADLTSIETPDETGFHKTTRTCLQLITDAMLHHRWQEAAEYMSSYSQILEDTTGGMPQWLSEVIWRIGTEILHHHPNSKMEDYNGFYERMKNSGVKHYLMICLEHSFHLLLNGQIEDAKRQLTVAESWRYGKQSACQPQRIKLIQAYRSLLDYFKWCDKKSTLSSTDNPDALGDTQEMHSYFRQSSVNLKEILKTPGIWDPFLLSYIDMLEFYNDHEGALKVLNDYAYDNTFPPNPNAHVYLYQYLKRQNSPERKLMKVLKILHTLVPSHELMLEYCSLLLQSEKEGDLQRAFGVVLDLLDYACWKSNLDVWNCLTTIIDRLKLQSANQWEDIVSEKMVGRIDWWPAMHFTCFHAKSDSLENPEIMRVKALLSQVLCPGHTIYFTAVKVISGKKTTKRVKKGSKPCPKFSSKRYVKRRREMRQQNKLNKLLIFDGEHQSNWQT